MFDKLVKVFSVPELRQKIWLTLALLCVFRLGNQIPLPHVNQAAIKAALDAAKGDQGPNSLASTLEMVNTFSASNFGQATIFGLGIMPYISASIILQLLATVWPPLEKLQKEGEVGRKKINEYTRYLTVLLCIFQSIVMMSAVRVTLGRDGIYDNFDNWYVALVSVVTITAGSVFLMWVGEQIDEYGIGNGISLLIMAGILSRIPDVIKDLYNQYFAKGFSLGTGAPELLVLIALFLAVVVGVIFITQGQRRIPTQSAKHVRGRRVVGGTRQFLPLKVNQAGVMPIIFASSLLMFPTLLFRWLSSVWPDSWFSRLFNAFSGERGLVYNLLFIALIFFFCYFWTAITFNPKEIANNLKDYGSFIPGHRPGKRTAEYLERVMLRITYVGAAFLAVVAVLPSLVQWFPLSGTTAAFFGGTSLLIVVSVGLDLIQKIDSHLVMRNYGGLLES
ncbi:MAG: preprotein translocase subunit SecY [Planctomycetaceae bacterium]|jgi:preprotein translocase subunit SecY